MRADKPDANRAAIVADLRERGYIVIDIGGCVDIGVIGHNHNMQQTAVLLVEIKAPGRKIVYTASEKKLQEVLTDRGYQHAYLVAQDVTQILAWFGQL